MTPEQQRIAIAEACGWRYDTTAAPDMKYVGIMCWIRPGNDDWRTEQVPDYLNDLNAIHEAEKVLTIAQRIQYKQQIGVVMSGGSVGRAIPDWWLIHEASPAQRAEAFLRTLNLWKE